MQIALKVIITVSIILIATLIGRKAPSLAGLIAVMPLSGLLVLFWLNNDNRGDTSLLLHYTKGALWGIAPTILFYITAAVCMYKQVPFYRTILVSFVVWIAGAVVHQVLVK